MCVGVTEKRKFCWIIDGDFGASLRVDLIGAHELIGQGKRAGMSEKARGEGVESFGGRRTENN